MIQLLRRPFRHRNVCVPYSPCCQRSRRPTRQECDTYSMSIRSIRRILALLRGGIFSVAPLGTELVHTAEEQVVVVGGTQASLKTRLVLVS